MEEVKTVYLNENPEERKEEVIPIVTDTTEAQVADVEKSFTTQDAMALMNLQAQALDMRGMRDDIVKNQLKVVENQEVADAITAAIANLSVEDVKALTEEEIEKIYTVDGQAIELDVEFDKLDAQRQYEFKRDFLVYMKESSTALAQIDEALNQLEADLKANEVELKSIVDQYGDLTHCIRAKLLEDYQAAEGDRKLRYEKMIANYDYAFSLDNLYETYKTLKPANTLRDYLDNTRAQSLYNTYVKVLTALNLKGDLTSFTDLEVKYLPEKYHKYPNLFLFLVIRYMAYRKNVVERISDGIFLSQFNVYIKTLYSDRFLNEEEKQNFIQNIEKVLDIFY